MWEPTVLGWRDEQLPLTSFAPREFKKITYAQNLNIVAIFLFPQINRWHLEFNHHNRNTFNFQESKAYSPYMQSLQNINSREFATPLKVYGDY